MSLDQRFDSITRERLRVHLLDRGRVVATLLSEVLAGKDKTAALEAILSGRPGIRPDEALRKVLDQIERRRELLVAGDDRYGRCDVCGIDLGSVAIDEMPWADRCLDHRHP